MKKNTKVSSDINS